MTIRFYDNDEDLKVSFEMNNVKIECQCKLKQFGSYEDLKYSVEVHDSDSSHDQQNVNYESIKPMQPIQDTPTNNNASITTPQELDNSVVPLQSGLLIRLNRLALFLNWLYRNE